MKTLVLALAVAALVALAGGQAFAKPVHTTSTKLTVVMKDPGCHWFSVAGKFKTRLAVAGPARLFNVDEAALKIAAPGAVRHVGVGKTIVLGKGTYAITMVGQAPDDNHLKLIVH